MYPARWLAVLMLGLTACSPSPDTASSEPPPEPKPPADFPDLNAFTAVDRDDYRVGGTSFVTPDQIECVLDWGAHRSIRCGGNIEGLSESVTGTGCPHVRKSPDGPSDAPYVITRSENPCVSARWVPIEAGHKLVAGNGTCVVGEENLVACIDADMQHGFVLQPSGSWTF